MTLESIIKSLGNSRISTRLADFEVKGISCDSTKISDNFIFVAIKGNRADGHKFIPEAIERGAKAIIVDSLHPAIGSGSQIPIIAVEDTRIALGRLAAEFYQHPSRKIKVVGVTGTNGKTTITYLIEAVLKQAGQDPAVLGTINYRFKNRTLPSFNTTPGPLELQSLLAQMLKDGAKYAIMEVSSHALDQNRTEGIDFHSAIFTNLTQDHLDYHRTMEAYLQAKLKLFKNLKKDDLAVINNDANSVKIKEITRARIITYGIENPADLIAKDIKFMITGTEFLLESKNNKATFNTGLIGKHNVYNILATVAWATQAGLDFNKVKSAIENFSLVPGRLERIESPKGFTVFIDYAHTEDALKNAILSLRNLPCKNIITVFGCGGERDKTKRPKMGQVVSELADFAVITSDNPRSEDPLQIIEDIKKGIKKDNYSIVPDRKEAIKQAFSLAKTGDIVLVAGKGHEAYQILKNQIVHFDDREVVKECLK